MNNLEIKPIGIIKSDFKEKFGIPRNSGRCNNISTIEFYPPYNTPEAFKELEGFSHIWIIFDFSLSHSEKFSPTVRPPRLGGNKHVGVFASRSPFRPNPIGLSAVKLEKIAIENGKCFLTVSGADLLDGTPILDIKPYIPFADCIKNAKGGYSNDYKDYKLNIDFPDNLKKLIPKDKLLPLTECLSDDPRPAYQNDDRIYGMKFSKFNIKFCVKENTLYVLDIENI